jgi:hypothetical protein
LSKRSKRPRSRLTGLHHNLAEILGEESLDQLIGISRLRSAWPDIVGSMMASRTEPIQIEHLADGGLCLWIAVDHSIMAQQIRFLRDDIRKACFKHARISKLHKIRSRMLPGAGIKTGKELIRAISVPFRSKRKLALELGSIKHRTLRKAAFQARLAQLAYEMTPIDKEVNK